MFDATLGRPDPESGIRWIISSVGLVGLVKSVAEIIAFYMAFALIRHAVLLLVALLFGGPLPMHPMQLAEIPEVVEIDLVEAPEGPTWERDEGRLAEPEDLIGEAPVPEDPTAVPPPELVVPRRAMIAEELTMELDGRPMGLLAMIGTRSSSGGAVEDVFASGEVSGLSGLFGDSDSLAVGSSAEIVGIGSVRGGGGRAEGIGRIGRGSGAGGGGTGSGGLGTKPRVDRRGQLTGEAAGRGPVVCRVLQTADGKVEVRSCPPWAHADARRVADGHPHLSDGVRVSLR